MVKVTVLECDSEPLVPVIVTVNVPLGPLREVLTENVELPEPVTLVGENEPVAPLGNPLLLNATFPVNPLMADTVTVKLVERPCRTDLELGETEIEKSAGVVTTRVTLFE